MKYFQVFVDDKMADTLNETAEKYGYRKWQEVVKSGIGLLKSLVELDDHEIYAVKKGSDVHDYIERNKSDAVHVALPRRKKTEFH